GIIVASIVVIGILKAIVFKKLLARQDAELNGRGEFIAKSIRRFLVPILYLGALYLAIESLQFNKGITKVIEVIYLIFAAWFIIRFIIAVVNYFITKYLERTRPEEESKKLKPLLSFLNFLIWIIGLLFLLDNLGFQISTVVAGLGISGIAVALAAQALLGDLFSYFVIFFDKPFEVGDFIIFDDKVGTIERIGIKSTKIRSLSGEQIIVSNSNLTNSRVHNYKRMERRRVVFTVGVTYQTKSDQLKEIPQVIKGIIDANEQAEFDRTHFKNFGDFSLNFETVYYVNTSDYTKFMDIQQEINLKVFEEFEKRKIEFAYPTQTLFLNKSSE
ncbi:MAG: mechanosensitive ion channel protein MscS, partial [Ignavibacteria bacterium RBG_13_36_8]